MTLWLRRQRGCIFFVSSNAAEYHLPTYLRFILRSLGLSLNTVVLSGIMPSLSGYQIASSECRQKRALRIIFPALQRGLKALANEDTLLRTHYCRHKCFPVCPRAQHLVRTQNMFLILFRNILFPQKMFPSLRSPRNIMSDNVSAAMRPRLPGPLATTGCVSLHTRRMELCSKLFTKINEPESRLRHLVPPTRSQAHGRSLRNKDRPSLISCNTERFKRSFFFPAMCLYSHGM